MCVLGNQAGTNSALRLPRWPAQVFVIVCTWGICSTLHAKAEHRYAHVIKWLVFVQLTRWAHVVCVSVLFAHAVVAVETKKECRCPKRVLFECVVINYWLFAGPRLQPLVLWNLLPLLHPSVQHKRRAQTIRACLTRIAPCHRCFNQASCTKLSVAIVSE